MDTQTEPYTLGPAPPSGIPAPTNDEEDEYNKYKKATDDYENEPDIFDPDASSYASSEEEDDETDFLDNQS